MNKKVVLSVLATAVVASMAASAFAAPKTGLYIGGNVKKFYSNDTLINMTKDARATYKNELKTIGFKNLVYVNFKGQGATIQEMIDLGVKVAMADPLKQSDFLESYGVVQKDGTINGTEVPKVDPVPTGDLKVDSVSAINANQLQVKFTQLVDSATAQALASYELTSEAGPVALKAAPNGAVLQADGKTVILNLNAPITTATDVTVTVKNVQLKDDSTKKIPLFTTVVKVDDKTAPTVTEVTGSTNTATASSVTVTFSEPVVSGSIKIDGVSVGTATGSSVTINGLSLATNVDHTLQIVNLTDAAGNVSQVNKTFKITSDAVAPVVSEVAAYGDKKILVTFSKKMNAATVIAGITAKDEVLGTVNLNTITALNGDTTGTKFVVPVNQTLYSTTSTRTLNLVFANTITDALGNAMTAGIKSVTLTKDTVAPAITGLTFKKNAAGNVTHVVVKFSEGVVGGTVSAAGITVVDGNGVLKSGFLSNATGVAAGATEVEFPVASPAALTGTYTFTIAAGLTTDSAETPNSTAGYTGTVNFGTAPAGDFKLNTGAAVGSGSVITVSFGQAVKGGAVAGSATDRTNYTLNGAVLPEGTTIVFNSNARTTAVITLPADSIATTDTAAVFTIANVQNDAGVTITPYTDTVSVKDNTKPVLQSARVLDNKTIELTFSEKLATVSSANVGDEFVIYEGTTAKVLSASELLASSVSGFENKLKITVSKGTDSAGSPANVGTVTASKSGSVGTVDGTYSGTVDKNYSVAVKTVDVTSNEATVITVDGVDINETTAGSHTFDIGNGLTINVSKGTATLAAGDTFTFTATAAVAPTAATTLDLSKDLSIKSVAATTPDVKDQANPANGQKDAVTVSVSK